MVTWWIITLSMVRAGDCVVTVEAESCPGMSKMFWAPVNIPGSFDPVIKGSRVTNVLDCLQVPRQAAIIYRPGIVKRKVVRAFFKGKFIIEKSEVLSCDKWTLDNLLFKMSDLTH